MTPISIVTKLQMTSCDFRIHRASVYPNQLSCRAVPYRVDVLEGLAVVIINSSPNLVPYQRLCNFARHDCCSRKCHFFQAGAGQFKRAIQ